MYKAKILLYTILAVFTSISALQAQVALITAVDSTPTLTSPQTADAILNSYTAGGVVHNFDASIAGVIAGTLSTDRSYGNAATPPVDTAAAISDNSLMTGANNVPDNLRYNIGTTVTAAQDVFVIFHGSFSVGFFDINTGIELLDNTGANLGTLSVSGITQSDNFGTADLSRDSGGDLLGRGLWGWSANVTDFGVANLNDVAQIRLNGGGGGVDVHMIGLATAVPEPSSFALIGISAGLLLFARRFRK